MRVIITDNGSIVPTNDRDAKLMHLTQLVDKFLKERELAGSFSAIGISEKCLMVGFVMWLKDSNKITMP